MQALAPACSSSSTSSIVCIVDRHHCRRRWSARAPPTPTPTPTPARTVAARPRTPARAAGQEEGSTAAAGQRSTSTSSSDLFTCRRCLQRVSAASNHAAACRYHPALYSGGEVAKAIGFVRASADPQDQLEAVTGRKGLLRFWDCCGDEDAAAVGCVAGFHLTFDDEEDARRGWR